MGLITNIIATAMPLLPISPSQSILIAEVIWRSGDNHHTCLSLSRLRRI